MSRRETWNERYATRELVWSTGPNQRFAGEVKRLKPGKALDVACGEGRNALWMAEQGWSVTAIDFSEVAIEKAKRIAKRRGIELNWMIEDISRFPLPKQSYDLVAVNYLHTGIAERARWLVNVVEAVKPLGTFIYIGHDPCNIESGVGGPQDPDLLPGIEELSGALDGFRIDVAMVVERPVVNEPGHGVELEGIALDSIIRAVKKMGPG